MCVDVCGHSAYGSGFVSSHFRVSAVSMTFVVSMKKKRIKTKVKSIEILFSVVVFGLSVKW